MSKLQISLAVGDYDHVRDFVDGRVSAEGLDINFQVLPVPEIFDRTTRDQEWDVSEMSLGMFAAMVSRGDRSLVAIPVFPSRVFRHSALYVKKQNGVCSLDKLRGKRVGNPDWAHDISLDQPIEGTGVLASDEVSRPVEDARHNSRNECRGCRDNARLSSRRVARLELQNTCDFIVKLRYRVQKNRQIR